MGKKNVVTTKYMSVNERFADAINAGVFHGKQIILPSQIEQIDTASNHVLWNREKTKMEVGEQRRDILKTVVYDTNFCIIGIENQSDIHYIFPVRGMLYDALAYKKQWDDIRAEHREEKDLKGTGVAVRIFKRRQNTGRRNLGCLLRDRAVGCSEGHSQFD